MDPLLAPRLNTYDLVLVQEDFAYHELLLDHVTLPHRTDPKEPVERFMGVCPLTGGRVSGRESAASSGTCCCRPS